MVHQKQYRTVTSCCKNKHELVAIRTSRTITHEETVDPKEFKKTKEEQRKNEWTAKKCMDNLLEV